MENKLNDTEMSNAEMKNMDSRDDTLTNNSRGTNNGYISSETELSDISYIEEPEVPTRPLTLLPNISIGDLVAYPTEYITDEMIEKNKRRYGKWIQCIVIAFSTDKTNAKMMIYDGDKSTIIIEGKLGYMRKEDSIIEVANMALLGVVQQTNDIEKLHRAMERMHNDIYDKTNRYKIEKKENERVNYLKEESFRETNIALHDRIQFLEEEQSHNITTNVEGNMEQTLQTIRAQQPYIDIRLQIDAYREHNNAMKQDMRERLIVLDHKYETYTDIINGIQISIIVFATTSTFIQASSESIQITDAAISFISLCVTSYTSLLLAILKYMKYDERKENVHNLQQQFASFIVKLETRNDRLNTWCSDSFWAGHDAEVKKKEWVELEDGLKQEFTPLIEDKANLCCEFEKEMNNEEQKKLAIDARDRAIAIRQQKNELLEKEIQAMTKANVLKTKLASLENKKGKPSGGGGIGLGLGGGGYSGQSVLRSIPMNANTAPPGPVSSEVGGCYLCEKVIAKPGERMCQECLDKTAATIGKEVIVTGNGCNSRARVVSIDIEAGTCNVEYLEDKGVMIRPTTVNANQIQLID